MSMPAMRSVTTIEELWALPEDGQRHELLDGVHEVAWALTEGSTCFRVQPISFSARGR